MTLSLSVLAGCIGLLPRFDRPLDPPDPSLKVLVAQVRLDAPVKKSTDIHSFEYTPTEDFEDQLRAQLIEEVEVHAQRVLTEELAKQTGFEVVPFSESRRMRAEVERTAQALSENQVRALGRLVGTDVVMSVRIDDYGRLQWDHWVFGWLSVAATHTAIVGAATGWNPLAMGAYLAYDLATDLPLWYGGAYLLGWAVRPVHVIVEAVQLQGCEQEIWKDQEVAIIAGRKELAAYPPAQRKRKEVQLRVNLEQALRDLTQSAGNTLRVKPCEIAKR